MYVRPNLDEEGPFPLQWSDNLDGHTIHLELQGYINGKFVFLINGRPFETLKEYGVEDSDSSFSEDEVVQDRRLFGTISLNESFIVNNKKVHDF